MMYEIKATEIVSVTTGFLKTGTPGTGSFDGTSPTEIGIDSISRETSKVTVNITIRLIETENQGGYENNCKLSRNWNIFHFFGIFLR